MFSTFKKLFGRQGADVIDAPAPAPSSAPAGFSRSTPAPPRAARVETSPRPAAPAAHVAGSMSVPLKSVLSRLPAELKQRVRKPELGDVEISVPLQKVIVQIAQGSVKITFGELRVAAPAGTFAPEADRDAVKVELPLNEVLSRLDPALLPRRSAQKQVNIPAEITGPFGGQAKITFTTAPLKSESAPVAPATPEPMEMLPLPQAALPRVHSPTPVTPFNPIKPAAPQQQPVVVQFPAAKPATVQPVPARPFQPSIALAQAAAASRTAVPSTSPASLAAPVKRELDADTPIFMRAAPLSQPAPVQPLSMPKPAAPQPPPISPFTPELVPMPALSATPSVPLISTIAPEPEQEPEPIRFNPQPTPAAVPSIGGETRFLTVAIAELAGGWPGPVQQEVQTHQLMTSSVALPFGVIETAIKQGKVALPWRILRSWIKPPAFIANSANDPMMLELPLKIITPIFLAEIKSSKPQKKLAVDESIPNLFSNRHETLASQPHSAAVAAFASATPAPAPALPPVAPLKPSDTNYFTRLNNGEPAEEAAPPIKPGPSPGTAFLKRYATPNDIVSKAAALPGVDGALIALPDGLLVASAVSPQMNAETIAGFLSQIYNRVNTCAKELRMGELNNLNFTVGSVPWKIFKVGAIYFAAFGRPGEPLPTAQLAVIAAELDRKAK